MSLMYTHHGSMRLCQVEKARLSVCPFVCLSIWLSICTSVRPSDRMSVCVSVRLPASPSILLVSLACLSCLSVLLVCLACLSVCPSICPPVHLSFCLTVHLCVRLPVCPSCLSVLLVCLACLSCLSVLLVCLVYLSWVDLLFVCMLVLSNSILFCHIQLYTWRTLNRPEATVLYIHFSKNPTLTKTTYPTTGQYLTYLTYPNSQNDLLKIDLLTISMKTTSWTLSSLPTPNSTLLKPLYLLYTTTLSEPWFNSKSLVCVFLIFLPLLTLLTIPFFYIDSNHGLVSLIYRCSAAAWCVFSSRFVFIYFQWNLLIIC